VLITVTASAIEKEREIPAGISQWIDSELAKARRNTLMDFEAGEFFQTDTARLIGYINGYDSLAGFSTGMISARNQITREDYPLVVQIREDGRFEVSIPMNYPDYMGVWFEDAVIYFYIQPGQTLAILSDWEDSRFKNIRYQGVTAGINSELSAFNAQLPTLPTGKIYSGREGKSPDEFKSFLRETLSEYTAAYQRLLETEKLSELSKNFLRDDYQIWYAMFLFEYEVDRKNSNQMPLEFYDFLQDIPMNNRELLSTQSFSRFINRLEYCQPFMNVIRETMKRQIPEKTYTQYLFEELNIPKTPEDEAFIQMQDSINIKINSPEISQEEKDKLQ
jgi:hypothetical protein